MEFILRVQEHTPEEIHLHHKISFSGVDYDERYKEIPRKNFISVDAQLDGFTCLNAVSNFYGWNTDKLKEDCEEINCEKNHKVFFELNPVLVLLPLPTGDMDLENSREFYFTETIKFLNWYNADSIHITQFSFLEKFSASEAGKLLKILLNPLTIKNFNKVYWEIDSRFVNVMLQTFRLVANGIFRLNNPDPVIIYAKRYKFIYDEKDKLGNCDVGRFVSDD